jgi:hypothetical protein
LFTGEADANYWILETAIALEIMDVETVSKWRNLYDGHIMVKRMEMWLKR